MRNKMNLIIFNTDYADNGTDITAHNTYEEVHTASFAFIAHNAVGNIANENTCKDWPRCEICNMF